MFLFFQILFLVSAIVSSVTLIIGAFTGNIIWAKVGFFGIVVWALSLIMLLLIDPKPEPKPKEFPASEYTLDYKVIEYQGQTDTIYVLTKKYEYGNK